MTTGHPDFRFIRLEQFGPLMRITLDRPEVLNALHVEAFSELTAALVIADTDHDTQIAIVTGAGRGFCTGADLKAVVEHHLTDEGRRSGAHAYAHAADGLFRQIREMNKIVLSMVNGVAYGGGLVLAACSDIAVASNRAQFRISEGLAGIADELSTLWLVASVGVARAKHLILTAETFSAAEAERLGLIAKVAPHDELWKVVLQTAEAVLKTGPRARSMFKRIINERLPEPRVRHIIESHLSDESQEGCAAFAAKRAPAWAAATDLGLFSE